MSKINVRNLSNENEDGAPDIVGVTTFSANSYFVPTKGTTAQRPPQHLEEGSIRYNTDTKNLEYYRGDTIGWAQFELIDPELGKSGGDAGGSSIANGLGTRALFAGGDTPTLINTISFATLSSMGNSADFGDLSSARANSGCISNRKTIAWCGGYAPSISNSIETAIFASTGNAVDTADLTFNTNAPSAGGGDNTRGIIAGGANPSGTKQNIIQYYTFETAANAVDFGDATDIFFTGDSCASSTRTVFSFGFSPTGGRVNILEFVTTSTTGDSQDFGDLTTVRNGTGSLSNSTRGVWGGGEDPSRTNTIDYVTIATTGNAIDFGDMTFIRANGQGDGASSPTRGVFSGGGSPGTSGNDNGRMNVIDKIEILTTGNAIDFGDLIDHTSNQGVASNNHGGL